VVKKEIPMHLNPATFALSSVLALASHAAAQGGPGKTIFNVIEFGATGDGATDDRVAIQNALTAAEIASARAADTLSPSGAVVFFPEGVYRVTGTLSLNSSSGIEIVGVGIPPVDIRDFQTQTYLYPGPTYTPRIYFGGPCSAIIADFPLGTLGPLFSFSGQFGHSMRDLALFGCLQSNSHKRAFCTALIHTASEGWGNSLNKYEGLRLQDAVKGFALGLGPGDGNNDLLVLERIYAYTVDTVFQTQTSQSVNLAFRQITASECKTVFDFDNINPNARGGCVSVDTLNLTGCGGTGTEEWCIKVNGGIHTGMYRFCNVHYETNTQQLLRSRGVGITELSNMIDARNFEESYSPLIRLEGGSVLVAASRLVPTPLTNPPGAAHVVEYFGTAKKTFRVRDCILPVFITDENYINHIIKNLDVVGSLPANSAYRINTCDDRDVTPLLDQKSTGSW
jgi:hypothetical protein